MDQDYITLNVGASTFKADLLFFHRGLQALVAVELKRQSFILVISAVGILSSKPFDRDVKRSNENPSIGILLRPDVDKMVVEYAMSRSMSPTWITEYKRIPYSRKSVCKNNSMNIVSLFWKSKIPQTIN